MSDAIPVHLLTREAIQLYFRHLKPAGVLALHISNRYLDLKPVSAGGARAVGRLAWAVEDEGDQASYFPLRACPEQKLLGVGIRGQRVRR